MSYIRKCERCQKMNFADFKTDICLECLHKSGEHRATCERCNKKIFYTDNYAAAYEDDFYGPIQCAGCYTSFGYIVRKY